MQTGFDLNGVKVPRPQSTENHPGLQRSLSVCPFAVVVSSNEVAHAMNYTFGSMAGKDGELIVVPTVSRHLVTGDYAIDGLEDRCCVERKQLEDLFMCCGTDRTRFHAEVERMAEMEFSVVVIEANWWEILNPQEHRPGWQSQMNPRSVEGTIAAWSIRYPRVHWWAAGDRRGGECRTFSILRAFWNERHKQTEKEHSNDD